VRVRAIMRAWQLGSAGRSGLRRLRECMHACTHACVEATVAELTELNQKLAVSFALVRWQAQDAGEVVAILREFLLHAAACQDV
jgi:hypothetical protein